MEVLLSRQKVQTSQLTLYFAVIWENPLIPFYDPQRISTQLTSAEFQVGSSNLGSELYILKYLQIIINLINNYSFCSLLSGKNKFNWYLGIGISFRNFRDKKNCLMSYETWIQGAEFPQNQLSHLSETFLLTLARIGPQTTQITNIPVTFKPIISSPTGYRPSEP